MTTEGRVRSWWSSRCQSSRTVSICTYVGQVLTYLPCPEEPIAKRVHASKLEVQEPVLHVIAPGRRIEEGAAISTVGWAVRNTTHIGTAVVDCVTELAGNGYAEVVTAVQTISLHGHPHRVLLT